MARKRPSKHLRTGRALFGSASGATFNKSDGNWISRTIPGNRAIKVYICPGCNHQIYPGVAHIVVWPALAPLGSQSGVDHRRHWHNNCWNRRP